MKKNSLLLLVTAVFLATGVALLARSLLAPPKAPPPPPAAVVEQPLEEVLVASHDIEPGDFIDSSHLVWKPAKDKPSRSLYYIRNRDTMDTLYGATVRESIKAGEAIRTHRIIRRGEPGFLAAVLAADMRAVSIPTSRVESNYGLVSPGDRVDVILGLERTEQASVSAEVTPPFLAAQTILHDVRVLALNNVTGSDPQIRDAEAKAEPGKSTPPAKANTSFETVTLEVDSRQAEKLAVAKEIGTLQLALRPLRASTQSEPEPIHASSVTTLRGTTDVYANTTPPASAPQETPKVLAFRGNAKEVIGGPAQ
ncbi:Flp pilus assembly protein CpaB [Pseudomonas sp. LJDD11]|uniref:Flp pilus assembly protein CpaB n=1 Tax=Pseudomonas sp. LJDD11 TaxID=2931984 RepID=UPI00211D10E6|nr:Flp pilus assembly protein CpaB [Pseudomonas sp. LJDD11]MCQ9427195.1 Flp pilus assembly protein CpaB [Pseudomonas sp. LJDD11]